MRIDERIIEMTISSGAEDGLDRISTKEMAAELGISEPTIYVHFSTKANLLRSAYLHALDDLSGAEAIAAISDKIAGGDADEAIDFILQKAARRKSSLCYAFAYKESRPRAKEVNQDGRLSALDKPTRQLMGLIAGPDVPGEKIDDSVPFVRDVILDYCHHYVLLKKDRRPESAAKFKKAIAATIKELTR